MNDAVFKFYQCANHTLQKLLLLAKAENADHQEPNFLQFPWALLPKKY